MVTIGEAAQATTHRIDHKPRLEHLDMVRGLAALMVCIGHIRGFTLIDYHSLPHPHWYLIPLYAVTGLGAQAVIIFFALSGYLVGGPALQRIAQRRWDAPDYLIHRLSRLWTSLIPAMIVGGLIDWTGRHGLHLAGYAGEYHDLIAGGPTTDSFSLSLATWFGNLAFLMNVLVPVWGSNGPLWSLAYEFAYYIAVPLAWLAVRGGVAWIWRVLAGALALLMVLTYPTAVSGLGTIWVAGALAYLVAPRVNGLSTGQFRLLFALVLVAMAITFPLTMKLGNSGMALFGCAFAGVVPCLARLRNPGGLYGRTSFWLSEISFTLYVAHYPLALFLWLYLIAPGQNPPDLHGLSVWMGLLAVTLCYVVAMWWLFERNTQRVRKWAQRVLLLRRRN